MIKCQLQVEGIHMKKLISAIFIFLSFFLNSGAVFAAVSIPSAMKQAMQNEVNGMPSLFNLIVSMVIVIGMIYLTGFVYTKLSRYNQSKLGRRDRDFFEANKFQVLSSMPLGQNKNLYAVEINGKVLVVGVTAQNISLLKEFDDESVDTKSIKANDFIDDFNEDEEIEETAGKKGNYSTSPTAESSLSDISSLFEKYKD